jgi:hypothetical protein
MSVSEEEFNEVVNKISNLPKDGPVKLSIDERLEVCYPCAQVAKPRH